MVEMTTATTTTSSSSNSSSSSSKEPSPSLKKNATQQTNQKCTVFIGYDHQDSEYRDRLVVQLHHLRDCGYIDSWSDENMMIQQTSTTTSTTSTTNSIRDAMEQSNIFLFLISPDFIASKQIRQYQVPYATFRAEEEGTAQVISIVVRSVHWLELPALNRFQALPSNLQPVRRWDDTDEAWLDVEKGIIQAIQVLQREIDISAISNPNPIPRLSLTNENDLSKAAAAAINSSEGGGGSGRGRWVPLSRNEESMRFDSIPEPPPRQQQQIQQIDCKVFISYAPEDVQYRDRLDVQLYHLQECGYIHSWLDEKKLLNEEEGQQQQQEQLSSSIETAMESSNVFLLLISPDFMASESILQHQVSYATQRAEAGTAKVISIVVRAVNWFELPALNRFQALPSDLYPVQRWEDQDDAWLDVEKGIIKAIRIFRGETSSSVVWGESSTNLVLGVDQESAASGSKSSLLKVGSTSGGVGSSGGSESFQSGHMEGYQGGSIRPLDGEDQPDNKCKVFISYSHKDPQYRDRLEVQLKHLQDRGFIDCWSDNQILPSMDWHSSILSAMKTADVFLLLVSPDFLASKFIMDEEVPYATKRAEEGTAQVVAIVVRSVHWSELPSLSRFQAFPSNLRPIKRWADQDEAWLDVEKGVIQAIRVFTGDVVDTFTTMASPALRAMRAFERSTSSSSITGGGGGSVSDLGTTSSLSASSRSTSKDPPLHFHRITDFWTQDIQEGRRVSLHCTLSRYAPMAIGSPFKKRDAHLAFRKLMSDPDKKMTHTDEAKLNSLLSFTAGQMAWSIEFKELPWQFLGLYQSIIRNSIPLFVHQDYYRSYVEQLFITSGKTFDARVVGRVVCLPEDFSALFADNKLIGTSIVKPKIYERSSSDDNDDDNATSKRPIYGILVDPSEDESTGISVRQPATYLDGDIWVAIQTNDDDAGSGHRPSKTSIHTRFCNLADEKDIADQVRDLKDELAHKYPKGYKVVFQFDQLEKRFEGKQKLDAEEMFGIVFE